MTARSARRQEQLELAASLRAEGRTWIAIGTALQDRYGLNALVAMRLAHGWGQAEAAAGWTAAWPDDPKTFKTFSSWENWPGPTGHAPSLAVLDRLAQLYQCNVADLLSRWGEHRSADDYESAETGDAESGTLAWQVGHLELDELSRSMDHWAERLPREQRRALLLKLSAATAVAAGRSSTTPVAAMGTGPKLSELAGLWRSSYRYFSTGRAEEFEGSHQVRLRSEGDRLTGRSEPNGTGTIELDLRTDGLLVTGSWTERTATDGYYRGAVYHGIMQLVLDPAGRSMTGRWLGPDKEFAINSGDWMLTRA
jgi:hypothetical protein